MIRKSYKTIPVSHQGYLTYQIAVPSKPICTPCYSGMSLEEIREVYGKDTAQYVFNSACQGVDLTKPVPMHIPMEQETVLDVCIEIDSNACGAEVNIYAVPGKYSYQGAVRDERHLLFNCHMSQEAYDEFNLNDELQHISEIY